MEVLADEELVGLDDGMESEPTCIHLPAVGLHEQMVIRRVKQKLLVNACMNFSHVANSRLVSKSPRDVSPIDIPIAILAY